MLPKSPCRVIEEESRRILQILVPTDITGYIEHLVKNGYCIVRGRENVRKISVRLCPLRHEGRLLIARDDKNGFSVMVMLEQPRRVVKKEHPFGGWVYRLLFGGAGK